MSTRIEIDHRSQAERVRHPEKQHRPDHPIQRKPSWIRVKAPTHPIYLETRELMRSKNLVTVCEEAACPNIGECWSQRHATMMIMGEICTRACAFCNVSTGVPLPLDASEPGRVADAVAALGLRHVVITSVDRDDLADGGAAHFAAVIGAIRQATPATTIEILTPDFLRKAGAIEVVVAASPDVFNHNLETVPRLYPSVRPGARYYQSLRLLDSVKRLDPAIFTKSGLMVGLGESKAEIGQVMDDLRIADVDFLTIADPQFLSRRCGFRGLARCPRRKTGGLRVTSYTERKLVPYAAKQLFDLVADVGKYPSFLPWCVGARVRSRTDDELVADLTIGFGPFRESFTSRVSLQHPNATGFCAIQVKYENGPFKFLHNQWKFTPDAQGCVVDFHVDFEFRSFILQKAIGAVFTEAVRMMVAAFLKRARAVYGPPAVAKIVANEGSKAGA